MFDFYIPEVVTRSQAEEEAIIRLGLPDDEWNQANSFAERRDSMVIHH